MARTSIARQTLKGEWVWPVEERHDYTLEEAAEVLAPTVLALQSELSARTVIRALTAAADSREKPIPPSAAEVDACRAELAKDDVFAQLAKVRPDLKHDRPTIRVKIDRFWPLNRAATALAARYPKLPRKAGARTARNVMAMLTNKEGLRPEDVEPKRVPGFDQWRTLLTTGAIFPPEAARTRLPLTVPQPPAAGA